MDKEQLVYNLEGVEIPVSEAQMTALHALDRARFAVLNGATESVALVETTQLTDTWRASYVSLGDRSKVRLLRRLADLVKKIRGDVLLERGNTPPNNRSTMTH